ncbi:MAG: hypothetical protein WC662_04140, partial [Candidatus Paceibacterota bacterium]
MKKYSPKIVCLLIVVAIITMSVPDFSTKKVEAASITGYIQDLTPVIEKLPGCAKIQNEDGTTNLWKSIKNMFKTTKERKALREAKKEIRNLKKTGQLAALEDNSIPILDKTGYDYSEKILAAQKLMDTKLDETKSAVKNRDKNESCLDSIGKAVVKLLINKFTESTVEWIRTGNNGGPMWVQHFGTFMGDIAKEQIMGFGIEIDDEV